MAYLASQMEAIGDEINDLADRATFNGKDLIGSSENDTFSIQTGEGNSDIMDIGLSEISMKTIFPENSLQYPSDSITCANNFIDGDLSDFNTFANVSVHEGSNDGSKYVKTSNPRGRIGSNIQTNNLDNDYGTYSVDVKTDDFISNIGMRVIDSGNNRIEIDIRPSNSDDPGLLFRHVENGVLVSETAGNANFDWGTWVNTKIKLNSNSAELLVNDTTLAQFQIDNPLNTGEIQLGGYGNVSYDNLSYTSGDSENERLIIDEDTVTDSDMRNLMNNIETALDNMNSKMNELGVNQRSLSSKEENLTQAITANSAAHSRIIDTDFAKEQSNSIRLQILQQTATAALSQANMGPQAVLGFLGQ